MAELKLHKPKNLDEQIDWASARNFLSFGVEEMAKCILKYLEKGESILVDTLGQYICDPNAFDITIKELRKNGVDKNYTFFRYPASQNPEKFRRLYARKVA